LSSETDELPSIDPNMIIKIRLKAHRVERTFTQRLEPLPDESVMPCLSSELAGHAKFAQVRIAIGKDALFFQLDVQGKRQLPWCRDSRLEDSDGLHFWIDTRNSKDVQRATRYCHRFGFLPMGSGPRADMPTVGWTPIEHARDQPPQPPRELMSIRSRITEGRYRLVASLHFDALYGLDPRDFPIVGCYFCVLDRELGCQSLTLQPDWPVLENPNLWAQLVL
jgi:hypothetical protein